MHEIKLLPHQWEAIHSTKKHTLLLGGVGSGKTYTGAHWCIKKKYTHP